MLLCRCLWSVCGRGVRCREVCDSEAQLPTPTHSSSRSSRHIVLLQRSALTQMRWLSSLVV